MNLEQLLVTSKKTIDGPIYTFKQVREYYESVNSKNNFIVKQIGISKLTEWNFDTLKNLSHKSGRFFKVVKVKNKNYESGILLQDELGTLGVLTCIYKDVLHFLVQFKKEPGNIISSQLSPTLQATLSNQNKVHGGNAPKYLELFENIIKENILFRASLPEQGNRYWKKYNDNVILKGDYFEEDENYRWMTLGQIYEFSNIDNSINSCLRSVLSLLHKSEYKNIKYSEKIKNIKNMTKLQKLNNPELKNSVIDFYSEKEDKLIFENIDDKFEINGISITIEDREVSKWDQPIVFDFNLSEYVFVSILQDNKRMYLFKEMYEPGYKNGFNLGPTFTLKKTINQNLIDNFKQIFGDATTPTLINEFEMSEEGGRFFQTRVKHSYYEIVLNSAINNVEGFQILDDDEVRHINNLGLLTMEARSLLFFANFIYN
mgnify:CR=1 FL=1